MNDQIAKLNLCEACAKQKGTDVEQHFGIADLLSALSDVEPAAPAQGAPAPAKSRCSSCGLTYEDFKKMGRLGCSECYQAFRSGLLPLLKRIHGSNQHVGKSPSPLMQKELRSSLKLHEEIEAAKQDLLKAVKKEEFEEAAALRDKIKFLEKKMKDGQKEPRGEVR